MNYEDAVARGIESGMEKVGRETGLQTINRLHPTSKKEKAGLIGGILGTAGGGAAALSSHSTGKQRLIGAGIGLAGIGAAKLSLNSHRNRLKKKGIIAKGKDGKHGYTRKAMLEVARERAKNDSSRPGSRGVGTGPRGGAPGTGRRPRFPA